MVKLSLPTNVVFSVHVHICDAAYISSITSNSFLNLDSWAWFHFWGHLHFWGLLPPFCHFHFLVCPPLLVCLHLLSLLFLGCFYFLGCLIKSPIFAVQKAIAPKNRGIMPLDVVHKGCTMSRDVADFLDITQCNNTTHAEIDILVLLHCKKNTEE